MVRPEDIDWGREVRRSYERWVHEVKVFAPWVDAIVGPSPRWTMKAQKTAWDDVVAELSGVKSPRSIVRAIDRVEPRLEKLIAKGLRHDIESDGLTAARALLEELRRSRDAITEVVSQIARLDAAFERLVEAMDFRPLYDRSRALFAIGYNVSTARLDGSFYDLLASEARLASLFAIAKGDVPEEHWFKLGRPRAALVTGPTLLSWSGSMFEYLMPLLVMRTFEGTLLHESLEAAVVCQEAYAKERGVPWGMSESAFNTMDLSMTYQYKAFGVPWLGFKPGLKEDVVVAPYATVLAALLFASDAAKNLERLTEIGAEGGFGFYESIDFTPSHVPPGKNGVVVKAYMAHHQGMSLVALDNVLNGAPMQRRFHADVRVQATELLLEERVPVDAPLVEHHSALVPVTGPVADNSFDAVDVETLDTESPPRIQLLGHGELSTMISTLGAGVTTWRGMDIHRFREDATVDAYGLFAYVRNVSTGALWSAGYEPTRTPADRYRVEMGVDKVEIRRRDGDVETVVAIGVSPEHPAEVRRFVVTNHGKEEVEIELTTYAELVLAPRNADIAHRAFGDMFVETEGLPAKRAMLARRRTRAHDESETWVMQVLAPEDGDGWYGFEFEGSRSRFIGRGRTPADPAAFDDGRPLVCRAGDALDPALVLRKRVRLAPGARARLTLTTALAPTRAIAMALIEAYGAPSIIDRTFELGWADARVELKHLGMSAAQASRSQRLLSAIVYPRAELRAAIDPKTVKGAVRDALWAHGVSGDLPILLLAIDDRNFDRLTREVLVAHEYWRINGMPVDLVILNEEASSYEQPAQQQLLSHIAASPARGRMNQRGGIFVIRADQLGPGERSLLLLSARAVLSAKRGSLARQLKGKDAPETPGRISLPRKPPPALPAETQIAPSLTQDVVLANEIGGFSRDGREYIMVVGREKRTPMPWCNVVANEHFGFVVSESGGGYSWWSNAQSRRLTPWSNDAVSDPPSETIYLEDQASGDVWSPTPQPAGGDRTYLVRHGFGYSVFEHRYGGVAHELTMFVDAVRSVKIMRLVLENESDSARDLAAYGFVDWVLGTARERSRVTVLTEIEDGGSTVLARNPAGGFHDRVAFFASVAPSIGTTADREAVSRVRGSTCATAGRRSRVALGACGLWASILALRSPSMHPLAPMKKREIVFKLGDAASRWRGALRGSQSFEKAVPQFVRSLPKEGRLGNAHRRDPGEDARSGDRTNS